MTLCQPRRLKDVAKETLELIERRMETKGTISGVPTGFRALDDFTDGWQAQLNLIGGRPSMGKSALLKDCYLAAGVAGYNPHLVNIEDGNTNTCRRLISSTADVEMWRLRKGQLDNHHYDGVISATTDMMDIDATIDDTAFDVEQIRESIHWAIDQGCKIVFGDYLQLVIGDATVKMTRMIGDIAKMLKQIAKEKGIPMVWAVQLNRGVELRENKRPTMADLRDSGEIEQHADLIGFLYRDYYYYPERQDVDPKKTELAFKKGRNEGTGDVLLRWDSDRVCFRDWDEYAI